MEVKKDCFAYKDNECTALNEINCNGCGFYKHSDNPELDREKIEAYCILYENR